jgi:hypothetical protein
MDRSTRWVYVPPSVHLCACLIGYIGLLIPSLQYFGILFTFVLIADLPISIPAYIFGWRYSALAALWVFVAGTLWWYWLSRAANALFSRYARRNHPHA